MIALSTSFISTIISDGRQLLKALARYDITHFELDCRITRTQFEQIKANLKNFPLQVSSLHNYCPFPHLKPKQPPGGDYFMLSSTDRQERQLAVEWTQRTIENANDMEAPVVVLHCGAVEMTPCHESVYNRFRAEGNTSEALQELVSMEICRRRQHSTGHLDALLFSLDRLLPVAEKYGVVMGLENRYHYFEIPDRDEFEMIFKTFDGAPVGYWHDTGHAHAQEMLGIVSQSALLEVHGYRLAGLHLHDAKGLDDHLAPGLGQIEFGCLKGLLDPQRPLVIELAPGTSQQDVSRAVAFAHELIAGT
ncbi:MAG: TIM barrel protein [Desulfobacteraceae bacterium]|jgi:sugar phosphate isomerase/epimerase